MVWVLFFLLLCKGTLIGAPLEPAEMLLTRMIASLGPAKGVAVTQRWVRYGSFPGTPDTPFTVSVSLKFPDTIRSETVRSETVKSEWASPDGKRMGVINGRRREVFGADPSSHGDAWDATMTAWLPLAFRSGSLLAWHLQSRGVDLTVTSLGRLDDTLVIIIGARYPDDTIPQLWLNKSTYRPVRWLCRFDDAVFFDVRYGPWHQRETVWFPMDIAVTAPDGIRMSGTMDTIVVNPSFPDDFFDVDQLRRRRVSAGSDPLHGRDSNSEVKAIIDRFSRLYRP